MSVNRGNRIEQLKRRRKRQLIQNICLGGIAAVLVLTMIIVFFVSKKNVNLEIPYDRTDAVYGIYENQMYVSYGDSFAKQLCVPMEDDNYSIDISALDIGGLFDVTDAEVLYAKNLHERVYPASLTKILTGLLAIKYGNLDDIVTVSANACNFESDVQSCGLSEGDTITLEQLLYGQLLWSGADASIAIAEHVGGNVDNFVNMMNEEAKLIGATNSHFTNPHGLHEDDHYSTGYDLYLLYNEAIENETFRAVLNTTVYNTSFTDKEGNIKYASWNATNYYFTGDARSPSGIQVLGGKTGTTDKAGDCLICLVRDDYGKYYISLVMNAQGKNALYDYMNELLEAIP